jgi:hypothetical protein
MSNFNFTSLYDKYPETIAEMPEIFDSHDFILLLAHHNQKAYVEALYAYREVKHTDQPAPFLNVHRILTVQLHAYPHLIKQIRKNVPSETIFGEMIGCTVWQKVK